jgi:hypothetical protein
MPQAENQNRRPDSGLPFGDRQSLPVGTLVTVRLKNPILTDNPAFSRTFDAVVDEPVLAEGNALVPRGAGVQGRVQSAQASELRRNHGYVRLTLESINIGGRDFPLQTSSLFVPSDTAETPGFGGTPSSPVVRLESGRRLTFRLTEPLPVANPPDTQFH